MRAIEKLTKLHLPEGDKAIFEKLPPPQKETAESEARNNRGRLPKRTAEEVRSDWKKQKSGGQSRDPKSRPRDPRNQPRNQQPSRPETQPPRGAQSPCAPQPQAQLLLQNGQNQAPNAHHHHKRRNRPGSRARRRMREGGEINS